MHSPFLYNLFICCGGDYKTFVIDISNLVEDKIETLYKEVENDIVNRKIEERNRSIFSKEFHKFVEKMENCKGGKNPQYCTFGFYKQIAKEGNLLQTSLKKNSTRISTDINTLKKFNELYNYFLDNCAEAVNEKRLKDLFVKIKDGKGLNKIQEGLFDFLLNYCFPNYRDERGGLLERINSESWEKVVFGDIGHQRMTNNILQKNQKYKHIHKLFDNFKNIKANEIDNIRANLVEISRLLDEIYRNEDFFNNEKDNNKSKIDMKQDNSIAENTISNLHSHILAFMRWIPIIKQNESNEKIMESIDNIIEQINVQACEIIDGKECLKQMLKKYPFNSCDSIFIQTNDEDLRKLLIKAMYNESYICILFQDFYKKNIFEL